MIPSINRTHWYFLYSLQQIAYDSLFSFTSHVQGNRSMLDKLLFYLINAVVRRISPNIKETNLVTIRGFPPSYRNMKEPLTTEIFSALVKRSNRFRMIKFRSVLKTSSASDVLDQWLQSSVVLFCSRSIGSILP